MALFINAWLVDDEPATHFISEQFLRRPEPAEQILSFHHSVAARHLPGRQCLSPAGQLNLLMNGFVFLDALRSQETRSNHPPIAFLLSSSMNPPPHRIPTASPGRLCAQAVDRGLHPANAAGD